MYREGHKAGKRRNRDRWDVSRGEGIWNTVFERPLNGWELEKAHTFLNLINTKRMTRRVEDSIFWKGDESGIY